MSKDQALQILGNRARWELLAIKRALSIHQWINTPEENQRLEAAKTLLKKAR